MYKLKAEPEDFIVEEISNVAAGEGSFALFCLKKKDYAHYKALLTLAKAWGCSVTDIGFAGTKDKRAITTQVCSVKGVSKEKIEQTDLEDIWVAYIGQRKTPVALGDLLGNRFTVTLRDVKKEPRWKNPFVNYYGEQRFSTNNAEIGKLLVMKNYKEAVKLIGRTRNLPVEGNDYVKALQALPKTLLSLYVGAYQAKLWNEVVCDYVKKRPEPSDMKIPLLGFGTESELYDAIMEREGIAHRDFINKSLRGLNAHGDMRSVWVEAGELEVEQNEVVVVSFSLSKGSYATEFIRQGFDQAPEVSD